MNQSELFAKTAGKTARVVTNDDLGDVLELLGDVWARFIQDSGFDGTASQVCLLPPKAPIDALIGAGDGKSAFNIADAPLKLPEGDWQLQDVPFDPTQTAIACALGGYQFTRYKAPTRSPARIVPPQGCDVDEANRVARGVMLTRDLVNTPANDMLPTNLEAAARDLACEYSAEINVIKGEALLTHNYPLIHAVGRASADEPRLIELEWGDETHPRLALVGKGVCFDTGGLDIKGAIGMALMKKDMGGAATVLGLARIIMDGQLPVRLHVLIPAVENAISGDAFRPGDILTSRNEMTIEIGNTDAEGRLVLADAIIKALEHDPDMLIDIATLTGAARIGLGPDISPVYSSDDDLSAALKQAGDICDDPIWPMPLWQGYNRWLRSDIANMSSVGGNMAGSITAALFLQKFAEGAKNWMHFDIYAWTPTARHGRPVGGEMLGARALWHLLKDRYKL